jgi:4,4'-diaponeurosporenoate glycosyltransferase
VAALGATAWVAACAASAAWAVWAAVAAVVAALGDGTGDGTGEAVWPAVLTYLVVAAHIAWLARRVGAFRWWSAALFPIPLACFVAVFCRSAALVALRRPVAWRGRTVPAAR